MNDMTLRMRLLMEAAAAKAEVAAMTQELRGLGVAAQATTTEGAKLGPAISGAAAPAVQPIVALQTELGGLRAEIGTTSAAAAADVAEIGPAVDRAADQARDGVALLTAELAELRAELARVAQTRATLPNTPAQPSRPGAQPGTGSPASPATEPYGDALDRLRARFVPLIAAQQAYQAELRDIAEAERLAAISASQAGEARARAAAGFQAVQTRLQGLRGDAEGASWQTGILVANLNDIAVMTAAGQSPLMLAMQQGTQITQTFGGLGAAGAVRMLGSSLLAMLNPLNLITLGVIAGGVALVQWAAGTLSAGEATRTLKERTEDLEAATRASAEAAGTAATPIDELRVKYGALADEVQRALLLQRELRAAEAATVLDGNIRSTGFSVAGIVDVAATEARLQAMVERLRATQAALTPSSAPFFDFTADYAAIDALRGRLDAVKSDLQDIASDFSISPDQAEALALATGNLQAAGSQEAQVAAADRLLATMVAVFGTIAAADTATGGMATQLTAVVRSGAELATIADELPETLARAARSAADIRAELERQVAVDAAIAAHGRTSAEVAAVRLAQEREIFAQRLASANIPEPDRPELMAAFDRASAEAQAAHAAELLATLEEENALRAAILRYGEGSAEVEALRSAAARATFEETLATLDVTEDQEAALRAAYEAGELLANLDMASGIDAAGAAARALADDLGISLRTALALNALGPQGGENPDPSGRVYSGRGAVIPSATDSFIASQGGITTEMAEQLREIGRSGRQRGGRGGGGGGGGRDTDLHKLLEDARQALPELELAVAQIEERVERGLMTTAEGAAAIAGAQREAAGKLADLIPELEALGPAGAGALKQVETALTHLGPELAKIPAGPLKDFRDNFGDLVSSVLSGSARAGDALKDLGQIIQKEIADRLTNQFVMPLLNPLLDGVMGALTGLFAADGAVISGGVKAYAAGGTPDAGDLPPLSAHRNTVQTRPTLFPMQGGVGVFAEAGDEAIMPLLQAGGGHAVRGIGPDGAEIALPLTRNGAGVLAVAMPAADPEPMAEFAKGGVPGQDAALPIPTRTGSSVSSSTTAISRLLLRLRSLILPPVAPEAEEPQIISPVPVPPEAAGQSDIAPATAASQRNPVPRLVVSAPQLERPVPAPALGAGTVAPVNPPAPRAQPDTGRQPAITPSGAAPPGNANPSPIAPQPRPERSVSGAAFTAPASPRPEAPAADSGARDMPPIAGAPAAPIAAATAGFRDITRPLAELRSLLLSLVGAAPAEPTAPRGPFISRGSVGSNGPQAKAGGMPDDARPFFGLQLVSAEDPPAASDGAPATRSNRREAPAENMAAAGMPDAARPLFGLHPAAATLLQQLLPAASAASPPAPWTSALMAGPGVPRVAPRRVAAEERGDGAAPYAAALQALAASGAMQGQRPVRLDIHNKAEGLEATEGASREENGVDVLELVIDRVRGAIASDVTRGSGPVPAAFESIYRMTRQGRS